MATNNTTTLRKDFDWNAYNAVMKNANNGLKLFLAQQMLAEIAGQVFKYNNPLAEPIRDIAVELSSIIITWKEQAKKAQRQTPVGQPVAQPDAPVFDSNNYAPAIF